jgi:hypothetical protein
MKTKAVTKTKKITKTEAIDKAYKLMVKKADLLEKTLGDRTNVETRKEGVKNFEYEVMFCNSKNKISKRIIKVSI